MDIPTLEYRKTARNAKTIPSTGIDSLVRTIRNAYQAASNDGRSRVVGATYTSYFITADLDSTEARQHGMFIVDSGGSVYKRRRNG